MNDSEGQIERGERQESSAQTLTPAAEAGPKQETAVALALWGVGSPKKRLLAFGMVIAYAVIFYLLLRIVGLLLTGARNLPAPTRNVLSELLLALCAIGAAVIAAKLERRKFSSYGFGDRLAVRRFLSA